MTRDAVSVLMPARDAGRTIGAAVSSTLRAMRTGDELLVLDDASADDTAQVLSALREPRLRVIRSDENLGVARGLGLLLEEARHGVVARMDADDVALPLRFARQLSALRGHDLAFGNIVPFGPAHPRFPLTSVVALPDKVLRLWWALENPVAHSAMIGRKPALVAVGGYRRSAAEDWDLWLRASAAGLRARRTSVPVTAYRLHPAQVSGSAAYRASLATDEHLESSWRAHLQSLGVPGADALALQDRSAPRSPLVEWLRAESAGLPPLHRRLLTRRLRTLALPPA